MKIKLLSLILVLSVLFSACGNDKETATQHRPVTATKAVYDSLLTPDFYKRMEGTIAGQRVVMHIQCYRGNIQGVYYYLNHGVWIILDGTFNASSPNNLTIKEINFREGEEIAFMDCKYDQGTLKGSWRSADGKKSYLIDLKESYPEGSYRFTTLSINDSVAAFPQSDSSPVAEVSNNFVIALINDEAGKWLDLEVKKALLIDTPLRSLDITSAVKKMNEKYLRGYKDEVKNMGKDGFASFLNYEDIQNISVCYNDNGYVILNNNVYSYSGGAHGNGGSSFYCLDVIHKKELKLADVLTTDSVHLQPIVESAFREAQGLKPADSLTTILFENHLATTKNFYFTNKGVGFYYFPYEVAAYAVGPIVVFVPFTALKPYLNPDFVQRMKLQ